MRINLTVNNSHDDSSRGPALQVFNRVDDSTLNEQLDLFFDTIGTTAQTVAAFEKLRRHQKVRSCPSDVHDTDKQQNNGRQSASSINRFLVLRVFRREAKWLPPTQVSECSVAITATESDSSSHPPSSLRFDSAALTAHLLSVAHKLQASAAPTPAKQTETVDEDDEDEAADLYVVTSVSAGAAEALIAHNTFIATAVLGAEMDTNSLKYPALDIMKVMEDAECTRAEAIAALDQHDGSVDAAAFSVMTDKLFG